MTISVGLVAPWEPVSHTRCYPTATFPAMTPCDSGSENPALDRMILVFVPDWSESCERKLCQHFSRCRKLTQIHLSARLSDCVQRPREVGSSRAGWHSFCNGISSAAEPVACDMLCTDFVATQEDFLEVASANKWLGIGLAGPGITWFVVWPSHTVWPHKGKCLLSSPQGTGPLIVSCLIWYAAHVLVKELVLIETRVGGVSRCISVCI